jgi:hypothetical protein
MIWQTLPGHLGPRVDYRYNVSSTSRAADAAVRLLQSTVLP